MASNGSTRQSPYRGSCIVIPTKHAKSVAIAPPFRKWLEVGVLEWLVDTDTLGTFSGEIEREGTALDCARRKCVWAIESLGVEYGLASEGSFGPHPLTPFLPCDQEILYFIDKKREFHLHMVHIGENTNYMMQAVSSMEELQMFAAAAGFPSHALILRPNNRENRGVSFKGIYTPHGLKEAFKQSLHQSSDGKVWVETDMRAQMNPSRMTVIGELAEKMAARLATFCPACNTPGWGCIRAEKGLHCEYCNQETEMIAREIYGCVLCNHTDQLPRSDGLEMAPQMYCGWCNKETLPSGAVAP